MQSGRAINYKELVKIENRVRTNSASINDLNRINDLFVKFNSKDFLLERLKELDVYSFHEYLHIVRSPRNGFLGARLRGRVLGVLNALKTHYKKLENVPYS